MKEQLIEKLEDAIINHQYGVDDMGFCCVISTKTIVDTIQALTIVKSESGEELKNKLGDLVDGFDTQKVEYTSGDEEFNK